MASRQPLLQPRRILAALAILVLFGGGGLGITGLVSAASEDGAPVYDFEVPLPRVGDRGFYQVDDTRGSFPLERLAFSWAEDRVVVMPNGTALRVNVLRLEQTKNVSSLAAPVDTSTQRLAMLVRAGSADVMAEGRYDEGASMRAGTGITGSDASWEFERDEYTFFEFLAHVPCGLRNPLQGASWDLGSDAIRNDLTCETGWGDDPVGAWQPVAVLDGEGPRVAVFEETITRDGGAWRQDNRYWVQEGMPYPIRIERTTSGWLDSGHTTYVLEGFTAGTAPLSDDPVVDAPAMPALQWAATTATGPSETGIDHAFPLSQAYTWARNDDNRTLADFLAAHPDAYMLWARHESFHDHEARVWRWSFAVTDGHEVHAVGVERRTEPLVVEGVGVADLPPLAVVVPGSEQTTTTRVPANAPIHFGDAIPPTPAEAPATMPTVASLWAQWRHIAALQGVDADPNQWAFSIGCDDDLADIGRPCAYGRFQVWAGHGDMIWQRETVLEPEPDRRIEGSSLHWLEGDLFSHTTFISETTWIENGAPAAQPPQSEPATIASLHGVWRSPGAAVVAGFTLAGLVTALTYWLWPALKTGPLGLFSRVPTDRLLQHPVRAGIMEAVQRSPGIHQRELARVTGSGKGALEHHLQKLEAGRLLSRHAGRGYTCYFPYGQVDRRMVRAAAVLRAPAAQNILRTICDRPGASSSDVAARTGLSNSTVHHHLSRLRQEGLVDASLVAGKHALRLTEAGEAARGAFAS